MLTFNKFIIALSLIFCANNVSQANPPNDNAFSLRAEKYFSYYDKNFDFTRQCFKPTVIKTGELDYINNYTGCLVDGLAHDINDGKHGYVDKDGKTVIAHQFKSASSFSDGLARVSVVDNKSMTGQRFGYIDKTGTFVIKPTYILGYDYSEGLIAVLDENLKYGFIDKNGNTILPFIYDFPHDFNSPNYFDNHIYAQHAYVFYDGVALVLLNDKWQFIDKQGNTVEYLTQ